MKRVILLCSLLISSITFSSELKVTGVVQEMGTRKKLEGVKIFFLPEKKVSKTVKGGEFEVDLDSSKKWKVIINLSGYKKYEELIDINSTRFLEIYLEKEEYDLFETTIVGAADKRDTTRKTLTYKDFYDAPGSGGDPVKAISNLPGVNRSARGAEVVIQGGAPEDTQYSINQQYVPIVFHFGSVTSVIMPEAIESIDYLSAGYGVEYGKAIGGIINLNTRSPRRDRYYGIGYLDILNGGFLIEGPINQKSSFLLSMRKSWVGEVLNKVAEEEESFDFTIAPSYSDLSGIYEYQISKNKKLSLTGIYSLDKFEFVLDEPFNNDPSTRGDFSNETSFYRLMTRYDWKLGESEKIFASLAMGKDAIFFKINDQFLDVDSTNYTLRSEYSLKRKKWHNYFGVDYSLENYITKVNLPFYDQSNGGVNNPFSIGEDRKATIDGRFYELGIYSRHSYRSSEKSPWLFSPGVRAELFSMTERDKSRLDTILLQPRYSMKYYLSDFEFLSFSTGIYYQVPQEYQGNTATGNPSLKPPKANHYNVLWEKDFRRGSSNGFKITAGAFLKDLRDLINSSFSLVSRNGAVTFENYSNQTTGRVYGGEFYLEYRGNDWSLNSSYTISKSDRTKDGETILSEYDQTHNLNVMASYKYKRWTFSSRFRYVTGSPYTPVTGSIFDSDNDVYIPVRGEFYSERNKDFIQLDIRVDRKWVYRDWIMSAYLDIQNVTNRSNTEGINYNYDYSASELDSVPLIPTFGIKGEF